MNSAHLAAHFAAETAASTSSQIVTRLATKITEDACTAASAKILDSVHQIADSSIRKATLSATQVATRMAITEVINMTSQVAAEAAVLAINHLESSGVIESICARASERAAAMMTASLRERSRTIATHTTQELQRKMRRISTETSRSAVDIAVRATERTLATAAGQSLSAHRSADEAATRIEQSADGGNRFYEELQREISALP